MRRSLFLNKYMLESNKMQYYYLTFEIIITKNSSLINFLIKKLKTGAFLILGIKVTTFIIDLLFKEKLCKIDDKFNFQQINDEINTIST